MGDTSEESRVLRPRSRPLRLRRRAVEHLRLKLVHLAQPDPQLVEELAPTLVGEEARAQFQRLAGRSSTRRRRQYFTFPTPPPPPGARYPPSRLSTYAATAKSAGTRVSRPRAAKT